MFSPWLSSSLTLAKPTAKSKGSASEAAADSKVTVGLSLTLAKPDTIESARVSASVANVQGLRLSLALANPAAKSKGSASEGRDSNSKSQGLSIGLSLAKPRQPDSVESARVSAPVAKAQGFRLGLPLADPATKSNGSASESDTSSIVAPGLGGHNGQEAKLWKKVITEFST